MKQILIKLAARFGLVSARRCEALESKIKELQRESKLSQRKADDLKKQIEKSASELKRHVDLLKQARAEAERLRVREDEAGKMSERLIETEHALAIAREQLTAVEVKLDILEGAANILDVRTRTALSPQHQPDKTGASV